MIRLKRLRFTPTRFHWWVLGLAIVMAAGAAAGLMVFIRGLVITNLNDLVPWGLWITIDLSAIALSAGAFSLCALVYLLGLKEFQSLARTATFVGLIGYSMAMLCLVLDIGRPDRFWYAFVFWNPHSVLWEVTMCVGLYFAVLALESAPIFGQAEWFRARWPGLAERLRTVHNYAPYLAIAGLLLSMLHQSSLGATYGVIKARPIWYRPDISVLFIISALAGGLALTTFASTLAARLSPKAVIDRQLLDRVSKIIGWVLVAYLYFRFWDALVMTYTYEPGRSEGLEMLTKGQLAFNFWLGELLLGTLVPIVILLNDRLRRNFVLRMAALALIVGGVVAYRWDTNMVGLLTVQTFVPQQITPLFTRYLPSLVEVLAGAGIIAYGLLAFTLGVKYLKIVDHRPEPQAVRAPSPAVMPGD